MADTTADGPVRSQLDLAKVLRLKATLEALRAELREMSPDSQSLRRLAGIQNEIQDQLGSAVTDELELELAEFSACCRNNPDPSVPEIRVAHAQLIGWIEGLLRGVQFRLAAPSPVASEQGGTEDPPGTDPSPAGYV